ncbi:MAG: DUF2793 domain-containing protein [Cyanobacteria bacterium J06638_20]
MTIVNIGAADNDGNGDALRNAFRKLNNILGGAESQSLDVGSATETLGLIYIVPVSATGAWSGQDGRIAYYDGTAWEFYQAPEGFRIWVKDEDILVVASGSNGWSEFVSGSGGGSTISLSEFKGVKVSVSTNTSDFDFTTERAIAEWDTEDYDTDGFWADTPNPSRITIPSGVTRVLMTAYVGLGNTTAGDDYEFVIRKNGTDIGTGGFFNSTTGLRMNAAAIINVVPGDYLEVFVEGFGGDTTAFVLSGSNFSVTDMTGGAVPQQAQRYARLTNNATQNLTVNGFDDVDFNTVVADVGGWSDLVSTPARLVVPEGVTKVRVGCLMRTDNASTTTQSLLRLRKNGVELILEDLARSQVNLEIARGHIDTGIIEVVPGDYFDIQNFGDANRNVLGSATLQFYIEEVPNGVSVVQHAVARVDTDDASADLTTGIEVSFDSAVETNIEAWDIANPTRLTVPAGVSFVELLAQLSLADLDTGDDIRIEFKKNGVVLDPTVDVSIEASGAFQNLQGSTYPISVVPGDYFEMTVSALPGTTTIIRNRTWMSMKVLG